MFLLILFSFLFSKPTQFYATSGKIQNKEYSVKFEGKEVYQTQIDSIFAVIDTELSLLNPKSVLSGINNGTWTDPAPQHIMAVYTISKKIHKKTHGYFDPTVGPILRYYGFYPDTIEHKWKTAPIELLGKIKIDKSQTIIKQDPEASFDFNAIVKGYMVDQVAAFLDANGCSNYLIELGGVIRAKGNNQQNEVWKIGIENPHNIDESIKIVDLNNVSIGTTGSFNTYKIDKGKKVSHVIDPKTGLGVEHSLLSVSVQAASSAEADAYATALLAMGLEKAKVLAKKQKIKFYAIYEQDGKLETYKTNGFAL